MTRGFSLLTSRLFRSVHPDSLAVLLILLAAAASGPSARAQTASTWNKRGQVAELHEDYDTAYEDYLKAHKKSPGDMRYTARVDRMRFEAAAAHVDRGRVLRQSGDVAGALNQFTRALQIDPGNEAAAQEIHATEQADKTSGSALSGPPPSSVSSAAMEEIAGAGGPLQLKPLSNDTITLHATGTTKEMYTAIAELAGLNVLFDPDLPETANKRVPVELKSVSLEDALRILGMYTGTFYKVVTADSIFIAQNTPAKHTALDELAIQTFYLTNPSQASDANEINTAIRNVLPPDAKIYLVPSQNALIVRATPDQLTLVQKLINDLDRTKAEVVVDIAILEVNRDKVRNLGITLPQSFGITPQASPNSTSTTTSTTTTGTSTTPSSFTLNTLANTNATNFAVTISGGTVNALLTDADTRVLQNPSVRATDGSPATLKIGSKIPVATGSYSAGAATGITAGIGVQTQFTYMDVGVNIKMTPTIHLDREVSLKLTVEVSTEAGQSTIEGVTEPIIGTRSDETVIQLHDGEPCLLAGLLDKEEDRTNSGTPGLSDIPFLRYFFGSIYKEIKQDEIVFIVVPHVVRESVLTRLNTRAIDTGTSTDIQLRKGANTGDDAQAVNVGPPPPAASATTAANAASAYVQQLKQQAMPPTQGAAPSSPASIAAALAAIPTTGAAASGPPVTLLLAPPNSTQTVGSNFMASVVLTNAHDVYSVPIQLQFDPKVLQLVNVDAGGLLGGDGQPVALVHRDDGSGLVTISASRPPGVKGVDGQGQVCVMTFKAIAAGDTNISLVKVGAKNSLGGNLPATGSQAVVHVK